MNIIAEKLRQAYHNDLTDCPILLDGAEEIDRLSAELARAIIHPDEPSQTVARSVQDVQGISDTPDDARASTGRYDGSDELGLAFGYARTAFRLLDLEGCEPAIPRPAD